MQNKLIPFKFTHKPVGRAAALARQIIFPGLINAFGGAAYDPNNAAMPTMAASSILTSWRKLVLDSVDLAVDHDDELSRRFAMANCLPSMVGVDGGYTARWCSSRYCPWCFGRRAEKVIHASGYKQSSRIEKMSRREGLFSIESRREEAIPPQGDPVVELASSLDVDLSMLVGLHHRNGVGDTKIEGGAYMLTVEPVPGKDRSWLIIAKSMGYHRGRRLRGVPTGWTFRESDLTEPSLEKALSDFLCYPTGFITGTEQQRSIAIEAARELRLFSTIGKFRTKRVDLDTSHTDPARPPYLPPKAASAGCRGGRLAARRYGISGQRDVMAGRAGNSAAFAAEGRVGGLPGGRLPCSSDNIHKINRLAVTPWHLLEPSLHRPNAVDSLLGVFKGMSVRLTVASPRKASRWGLGIENPISRRMILRSLW